MLVPGMAYDEGLADGVETASELARLIPLDPGVATVARRLAPLCEPFLSSFTPTPALLTLLPLALPPPPPSLPPLNPPSLLLTLNSLNHPSPNSPSTSVPPVLAAKNRACCINCSSLKGVPVRVSWFVAQASRVRAMLGRWRGFEVGGGVVLRPPSEGER